MTSTRRPSATVTAPAVPAGFAPLPPDFVPAGRHALVVGLGDSGLAMARWLAAEGARVTACDTRAEPPRRAQLAAELPQAAFVGGPFDAALLDGVDLVAWSPGLSPHHGPAAALAAAARERAIPVVGEIELFARALAAQPEPAKLIAITGTNGKTTTTRLVAHLLAEAGVRVAVAGNVSPPALDALRDARARAAAGQATGEAGDAAPEVWVLELSSFQLEFAPSLAPDAAAILNVTQDHLDWHGAMDAYAGAKQRIFDRAGTCVWNRDDPATRPAEQVARKPARRPSRAAAASRAAAVLSVEPVVPVVLAPTVAPEAMTEASAAMPEAVAVADDAPLALAAGAETLAGATAGTVATPAVVADDAVALPDDDAPLARMPPPLAPPRRPVPGDRVPVSFGLDAPAAVGEFGIVVDGGLAWLAEGIPAEETLRRRRPASAGAVPVRANRLLPADALRIRGTHNHANALAALALARAVGVPMNRLLHALRGYAGEPHRCESIAVVDDVEYVDDSKGTNVGATVAALDGLGRADGPRVLLIAGGDGKGQAFEPLAAPVARHARAVLLIGRDAPRLREALAGTGVELVDCATLDDAVAQAAARARTGDLVLLSPACASLDMFRNYLHRSEVFAAAVRRLAEERGQPC